ncbi:MAG: hypothetical protein U0324_28555 [Polyangiales bacterium]
MSPRTTAWTVALVALLAAAAGEGQTRRRHRQRHRGADAGETHARRTSHPPPEATPSAAPVAPSTPPPEAPAPAAPAPPSPAPAPAVAALPAPVDMVFAPTPAIASNGALVAPLVPPEEHDLRPVVAPPGSVPDNPYRAGRAEGRRFGVIPEEEILTALRNGPVGGRLRNYGNTSVNIRVDFPGPIDGSFKPSERLHEDHWRAEIAAFRLNQLLGLERVPPAVFRRVPEEELPNGARYGLHFDAGMAHGAMIYWVPVLRPSGVGSPESFTFWSARLQAGAPLRDDERERAEEVSTLVAFDFLLVNWDRWNGLNTLQDDHGHLVYRDNNAGFQVPVRSTRFARVEGWLHGVQRFSRRLIAAVEALTDDAIRDAIADDGDGDAPLLSEEQIADVIQRKHALLRYVRGLRRLHGDAEVLCFP